MKIEVPITKCALRRNKFNVRVNILSCADFLLSGMAFIYGVHSVQKIGRAHFRCPHTT